MQHKQGLWEHGGGEAGMAPRAAVVLWVSPEQLLRVRGTGWRRSRNVCEGGSAGRPGELGGKLLALQLPLPIF